MLNEDLIAYLQPAPSRFAPNEWRDVCGGIHNIHVEGGRLTLRAALPPGRYRCRLESKPGSFDWSTAMISLVRVPDGKRIPTGPWDLDHIHNVMAVPMARTFVNDRLLAGLWFSMPGPEEIAESRVGADFGFEAQDSETVLTLELVERDRDRFSWNDVRCLELRRDDRFSLELVPASNSHPRIYVNAEEVPGLRSRLSSDPLFANVLRQLQQGTISAEQFDLGGNLDLAFLAYCVSGDKAIGEKIGRAA